MGATLTDGRTWAPIVSWPNVVSMELAHRVESRRDPHNARSIARARREHRPVMTEHAGFHDLYIPIDPMPRRCQTGPSPPLGPPAPTCAIAGGG